MKKLTALAAMTCLAASPALGSVRNAAFASSTDRPAGQTSMFIGVTYRVGLARQTSTPRGRASLTVAGMARMPTNELRFGQGLEISGGKSGNPALYIAGRDVRGLGKQANMSNGGKIAIGVGVVVLVGAVVVAAIAIDRYDYCDHNECE